MKVASGGGALKTGTRITLIANDGTLTADDINDVVHAKQGALLAYKFGLSAENDNVYAIIESAGTTDESKAFSEGRIASMAMLNQGGDFIADQGMNRALQSTLTDSSYSTFAIMGGGKSRYNTGSHIDVEGVTALAGLAWGHDLNAGRLTLGAFFEMGRGNYNTSNSFNNAPSVKGDGDTEYHGGGILGRFDFNGPTKGGFYAEGSARMGAAKNEFSSRDLGINGQKASYDSDSMYFGLHAGAGYVWNFMDSTNLDVYGKFFWLHQNGDSVRVFGDKLKFDDADSLRARPTSMSLAARPKPRPTVTAWIRPNSKAAAVCSRRAALSVPTWIAPCSSTSACRVMWASVKV